MFSKRKDVLYLKWIELSLNWDYDWHSRTTKVGISEKRRRDRRPIMLYKDLIGAFTIHTNDLVPPIRHVRKHHFLAFQTPFANTDIYKRSFGGPRWLSGRVSDSGARSPGFETYRRRVVSLSKTLYSPKVLVNYPGSDGSVPKWLKNCWLGR